jgi:hypothetical protein
MLPAEFLYDPSGVPYDVGVTGWTITMPQRPLAYGCHLYVSWSAVTPRVFPIPWAPTFAENGFRGAFGGPRCDYVNTGGEVPGKSYLDGIEIDDYDGHNLTFSNLGVSGWPDPADFRPAPFSDDLPHSIGGWGDFGGMGGGGGIYGPNAPPICSTPEFGGSFPPKRLDEILNDDMVIWVFIQSEAGAILPALVGFSFGYMEVTWVGGMQSCPGGPPGWIDEGGEPHPTPPSPGIPGVVPKWPPSTTGPWPDAEGIDISFTPNYHDEPVWTRVDDWDNPAGPGVPDDRGD